MAVAFVKKGTVAIVDSGTSIAPTIGTVTAGNLIVALFWVADGTGSTTALSAPSGWTAAETPTGQLSNGYGMKVGVFYKQNAASGSHTATLSMGTGSYAEGIICEFSGASTTAALGVHTNNKGGSATSGNTGTTGTSTVADAVAIAVIGVDNGVNTSSLSSPAATGYTSIAVEPNDSFHVPGEASYKILSATGTQSGSWTWSNSSGYCAAIVVFQADPSGGTSVTPGVGSVAFSGFAPTVARTANQGVVPDAGALSFTGQVPVVARTDNQTVVPGVGSLTFTGYAPTVSASSGVSVNPGVGAMTFTGYAPTIAQPQTANPGVGSLVLTGYAPTIAQPQAVNPGVGSITFTGFSPALVQTANQSLVPGVGPVVFTGYAPVVAQASSSPSLTPGTGALLITGYAPDVAQSTAGGIDSWGGVYVRKKKKPEVTVAGPPPGPTVRETIEQTWAAAEARTLPKQPTRAAEFDDDEDEVLMLLY